MIIRRRVSRERQKVVYLRFHDRARPLEISDLPDRNFLHQEMSEVEAKAVVFDETQDLRALQFAGGSSVFIGMAQSSNKLPALLDVLDLE